MDTKFTERRLQIRRAEPNPGPIFEKQPHGYPGTCPTSNRRSSDRRTDLTEGTKLWLQEYFRGLGVPENDLPQTLRYLLGTNFKLGLETRQGLTEFFLGRGLSDFPPYEEHEKDCVYALYVDTENLGSINVEYGMKAGDAVVQEQVRQIILSLLGFLGYYVIISTGGDEAMAVSRNKQVMMSVENKLNLQNSLNHTVKGGAPVNFSVKSVYPETPEEHEILSAALSMQSPMELKEVTAIAGNKIEYEAYLEKAKQWKRFYTYLNESVENQDRVLELMSRTNATIGLFIDLIKKLNIQKEVITSCISPMLFTDQTLIPSDIDQLVANICRTNVIKSNALVDLALSLGRYVLVTDPKVKVANSLGLQAGDQLLAQTLCQQQSQFTEAELRYLTPITKGPIQVFSLLGLENAKRLSEFEIETYRKLEARFKQKSKLIQEPIIIEAPVAMPVSQAYIDRLSRENMQNMQIMMELNESGLKVSQIMKIIQTNIDLQWSRDLINLLNTPENLILLEDLTHQLQNLGNREVKEYYSDYIENLESANELSFVKAIMMINRTMRYMDAMISILEVQSPGGRLLDLLKKHHAVLSLNQNSQRP
ncbi:MAG: hypothetical protein H7230_02810 [Candidatus Parcubacteria bacterium]|nr:hypothetical protein [Candidatus Paceibacterota bacterium]